MPTPPTSPLDLLQVNRPCTASWDTMSGDAATRLRTESSPAAVRLSAVVALSNHGSPARAARNVSQSLCSGDNPTDRNAGVSSVEHERLKDVGQARRRRQIVDGMRRHLRVVREHAGVVQQLLPIDGRIDDFLQTDVEEFKGLSMVACE